MTSPIDNEDLISILSKGSDTNNDTKDIDDTMIQKMLVVM